MKEILRKIVTLLAVIGVLYIAWGLFKFLFPVLLVLGLLYYFFVYKKEEKETVKWYEGTKSDSYYQKEKIQEHNAIDVEVKVRKQNDTSSR
ncbi:MAG: hypothetical protein IIZ33_07480 [Erysipelotrichaceae bacterium]|nr:hypothetical protein [Erysipelotrichaceae bacterium]